MTPFYEREIKETLDKRRYMYEAEISHSIIYSQVDSFRD